MKSALIAAVVAAVVATASATAAVTVVITSKDIKNGTIQTIDISAKAKSALKGNRGARGPAGARGPTGAQGLAGAAGAQGPPGIQGIVAVTNTTSVASEAVGDITATCPAGRSAVSGGFLFAGIVNASVNTGTGWRVIGFNDLLEATNISAVAYCSPNVTVTSALVNGGEADSTVGARRSAGR
jgi:collagen triple helix repeat protein